MTHQQQHVPLGLGEFVGAGGLRLPALGLLESAGNAGVEEDQSEEDAEEDGSGADVHRSVIPFERRTVGGVAAQRHITRRRFVRLRLLDGQHHVRNPQHHQEDPGHRGNHRCPFGSLQEVIAQRPHDLQVSVETEETNTENKTGPSSDEARTNSKLELKLRLNHT